MVNRDDPAYPSLLVAVNPYQQAPASLQLIGDEPLLRGPSAVPDGKAHAVFNPTQNYQDAPWSVGKGTLELRQLVLTENRTADRDRVSMALQFDLAGVSPADATLPGTITVLALDDPIGDAGLSEAAP